MVFKRKKRHKSTEHSEITSGSRDGSRTTTTYKMQLCLLQEIDNWLR